MQVLKTCRLISLQACMEPPFAILPLVQKSRLTSITQSGDQKPVPPAYPASLGPQTSYLPDSYYGNWVYCILPTNQQQISTNILPLFTDLAHKAFVVFQFILELGPVRRKAFRSSSLLRANVQLNFAEISSSAPLLLSGDPSRPCSSSLFKKQCLLTQKNRCICAEGKSSTSSGKWTSYTLRTLRPPYAFRSILASMFALLSSLKPSVRRMFQSRVLMWKSQKKKLCKRNADSFI